MRKFYYYLLTVPIICLFFGTTAFAGETFTWSQIDSNVEANYISSASIPMTDIDFEWEESPSTGSGIGMEGYYGVNWNFSNAIELVSNSGKFVYGVLFIEYDIYIPNPNTSVWSKWAGVVSGQGYNTETLRVIPIIKSTTLDHYIYRVEYIFDGFQVQNANLAGQFIAGPDMNIKMRLQYNGTPPSLPNSGVSPTGTMTVLNNSLRFEDTPLNHGLAALFAEGIDYSDKVDLMLQYLYDIKMNDMQYYQQLTSDIATILNKLDSINARLWGILTNMIDGFSDVQTVLDLFPSYRTEVLQYWQQLLAMNAQQSSAAAEIESQYQENEAISASLADGLGELNLPDVDMNDLDILSRVDQTQKANFFGMLSIITNNSFITTLLLIICTGAIVGFILYGKKG